MTEKKEYPVLVRVTSAECDPMGREENVMRMMMPGTLTLRHEERLLCYTESLQTDDGGHVEHEVKVLVRDNRITILRKGPYGMMMVLQPDTPYQGSYHTPYGDMDMDVLASRLRILSEKDKGVLLMEYQLRVGGGEAMTRRMRIEYAPRQA